MDNVQAALVWLKSHQNQMTSDLIDLCNINSGSENVPGLHKVADWLVDFFSPLDVPCQSRALGTFQSLDDAGSESENATGKVLRWDVTTSADPLFRILLSIHYDTVYGFSDSFQACSDPIDGKLRGPGVIDAKGGIVVLRYAMQAALRFLDLSRLDLSIVLSPDEEIGSPCTYDYWKSIKSDFDFAILFEPAMADNSFVHERKGTGTYVVVVRGKAAHSGRNFTAGRNAIVHAGRLMVAFNELNGQRTNVTVNVGRIRGGNAVNVVPDLAVVRVNVRVSDDADMQWLQSQVDRIVAEFHRPEEGFRVEIHGGVHAAPKQLNDETRMWMSRVEQAAGTIGESIQWKMSGGSSDGNKLHSLGLANIDTFGPEGDGLHSPEEWVRLDSMPRKAALVVSLLDRVSRP